MLLSLSALALIWVLPVTSIVLHTSERWILDSNNQRVKFRCVNWAGHMETNIPEGLNHQPVQTIANWIADQGFNCVRLTYSTDMALNPNQRVQDSFNSAASAAGVSLSAMQSLYSQAVGKNPWLASSSTRGAFSEVIRALERRNVLVVLDNHVSKASWCCGTSDGNGWWAQASGYSAANSRFFDADNWLQGLRAMSSFASAHPNVVGMALRNELRAVSGQDGNNHADWYNYMSQGARAVHQTNRDLLIIVGGVNYALDLGFLYNRPFDRSQFPNKVVWEFHMYSWSGGNPSDCNAYKTLLGNRAGYLLAQGKPYTGPLWLSEFGFAQQGTSATENAYANCLVSYLESNDAEWAYWALQGTYYVREGVVDRDESYGLMNRNWSGWRNSGFKGRMGRLFEITQRP